MTALRTERVAAGTPWVRCPKCSELHYAKRLRRALGVCPDCGFHNRLDAMERIGQLTDPDSFCALPVRVRATDVLQFTDSQPYQDRLAAARRRTGLDDAVVAGFARLGGVEVGLAVMDFGFMGGSLGAAVGELITRTAEGCLQRHCPLLLVTASGGARMQEGAIALLQMAKVSQALAAMREAGLLTVSLVTDPTYGGVAASFATSCDVVIAEQGCRMGFAGPRVIEQTIGQSLPPDFQTAQFLLAHGQVDDVLHRQELRGWLSRLLVTVTGSGRPSASLGGQPGVTDPAALPEAAAWDIVRRARDPQRPTTLDYLRWVFDSFIELHGDRLRGDCPAIVAGLADLDGKPVAVIGHQKGHTTKELVARQFGMPSPQGYRKALRVMRLAARLGIPIISFVDTPGAYPGPDAEEGGQSIAIAENILAMFELPTPIVTVVTGEGGSGGALALAVADRVLMFENATYSVISPEGCSAILWGSSGSAAEAAGALRLTARDLLGLGIVDAVIPEKQLSVEPLTMADLLHAQLAAALAALAGRDGIELMTERRRRFRSLGTAAVELAPVAAQRS
jgi:acetyl-CoA carboxylase carboxyl transferase alpha subunit/acetyl-CoA carboxylase carboxyl transferase beta subunit